MPISQAWKKEITQEYNRLQANEETIHNTGLHKTILETWKRDSPKMYRDLQQANLTDKLAYVLQQRMWDRRDQLMEAGLPVTDAREQAEAENLMLAPEDDHELGVHPELPATPPVPSKIPLR